MSKWPTPGYVRTSPLGSAQAAIAGPGSATLSASATHTSHGQWRVFGVADRAVGPVEQPSRRGAIAPAGVLANRDDVAPARLGARGVDERRLVRLSDRGEMATGGGRRLDRGLHARHGAVGLTLAVQERHLTDHGSDRGVLGGGRGALPPPNEDPNVATLRLSTPSSERANAIAARQSSSCIAGST